MRWQAYLREHPVAAGLHGQRAVTNRTKRTRACGSEVTPGPVSGPFSCLRVRKIRIVVELRCVQLFETVNEECDNKVSCVTLTRATIL